MGLTLREGLGPQGPMVLSFSPNTMVVKGTDSGPDCPGFKSSVPSPRPRSNTIPVTFDK